MDMKEKMAILMSAVGGTGREDIQQYIHRCFQTMEEPIPVVMTPPHMAKHFFINASCGISYKSYNEYKEEILSMTNLPENLTNYFNVDRYMLDQWHNKKLSILYEDDDDVYCELEDIGDHYPVWKYKTVNFFIDHPNKNDVFRFVTL